MKFVVTGAALCRRMTSPLGPVVAQQLVRAEPREVEHLTGVAGRERQPRGSDLVPVRVALAPEAGRPTRRSARRSIRSARAATGGRRLRSRRSSSARCGSRARSRRATGRRRDDSRSARRPRRPAPGRTRGRRASWGTRPAAHRGSAWCRRRPWGGSRDAASSATAAGDDVPVPRFTRMPASCRRPMISSRREKSTTPSGPCSSDQPKMLTATSPTPTSRMSATSSRQTAGSHCSGL